MSHVLSPRLGIDREPESLRLRQDSLLFKLVLRKLLIVPVGEKVLSGEPFCDLFFAFALYIAFSAIAPIKDYNQVGCIYRVIIAPNTQIVLIYEALQACSVRF